MTTILVFVIASATKAAAILAAAAVTCRLLRRQSAATRHVVWAAAIVASLLVPVIALGSARFAVEVTSLPSDPIIRSLLAQGSLATPLEVAEGPGNMRVAGDRQAVTRAVDWRTAAGPILFGLWLAGFVLIVSRILVDSWRAHRLIARAQPVHEQRLDLLLREFGLIASRARVLRSPHVTTPLAAGILRGAIILPERVPLNAADSAEMRAIIAHESGHLIRYDGLIQIMGRLACALYWFNPLQWHAVRAMRLEAEHACDDRAITNGVSPLQYAGVLLNIAAHHTKWPTATILPMASGSRDLELRLTAILDSGTPRHWSRGRALVASMSMIVLGSALASFQLRAAAIEVEPPAQRPSSDAGPQAERVPVVEIPAAEGVPVRARRAVSVLQGPDAALARTLTSALDHIPQHAADLIADRAAWALSKALDGRIVEPLIEALDSPDWREAAYAAWALSLDERAALVVPPLIRAMARQEWRVRANAAAGLARAADRLAIPAMLEALSDSAWQVRVEAVGYFGSIGDADSLASIRPALRDPHIAVRGAAETALYLRGAGR